MNKIRQPSVSGQFYPDNPQQLKQDLNRFFVKTEKIHQNKQIKLLITPHAGIVFSGQTAAWGYKQLVDSNISRAILLGVSHTMSFGHVSIDDTDIWNTPIGSLKINTELKNEFINITQGIILDSLPHQKDHTLELQAIFLKAVIPECEILPIIISEPDEYIKENLIQKLVECTDQRTIIIISTDLSHYPPYDIAEIVDQKTIAAIMTGSSLQFEMTVKEIESFGYKNLVTSACGQKAVSIALSVMSKIPLSHYYLLHYENSGDVGGDIEKVVGYAAIAGYI